ncbi:MAG: hypothetical protein COX81_01970 [Candidatus Magasanikbacteria bacterium CG_4_10_14_0_2_um_filter_37_12]|uniref:Transcriptional regulator n=1 Tax=Candidatus Magasanikbacteria bacterium CG_4_10_14_0_2_um_filter_37_12 TaxID=1974637 RepID=A0A2M7V8B7_9BACT|nr:MAG: hypothetical protein COX81_01970 [Candidatus Magasanikbacteria bacterium CG_4_10_14_0_2_um_filter_37_12]
MLEQFFGSKTRFRLLRLFFRDTTQSFYVRELARSLDVQINAIRRELELFLKLTLITVVSPPSNINKSKAGSGLRKYYAINPASFLYPEMNALLLKAQMLGEQEFINTLKEKAGEVQLLLLTGQFVGNSDVQSDILIIGNIKERNFDKLIAEYEKEVGFNIRYTVMTVEEFYERRQMMDKFIFSLFESGGMVAINELEV